MAINAPSSDSSSRPPKLLDQLRGRIRLKHYSLRTEQAYVQWAKRYLFFHGMRHPTEMGKTEIEAFLTALAVERNVMASTQNQALSALLFLYREVLGMDLIVRLLYGTGMHLLECLRLRVKDVEFTRNEIVVREGKGNKDPGVRQFTPQKPRFSPTPPVSTRVSVAAFKNSCGGTLYGINAFIDLV